MKKLLLLLFLGFTIVGFSQTTLIPDPNFEQALIDLGLDTAPINGSVPTANISGVTELDVSNKNISILTGIEGFTALTKFFCGGNQLIFLDVSNNIALTEFYCTGNQLTSLDVTANTALTDLNCRTNQLTSLDVSNNTELTTLNCRYNQFTSLDVSNNIALNDFDCSGNQLTNLDVSAITDLTRFFCNENLLTSLDVSANTALTQLYCFKNLLTSLDVRNGNNTILTDFDSTYNPDLKCIYVDDVSSSTTNWTDIDPASTFVENEAECALSIGDNPFELDVTIYPNPTDNYLFIEGNKNPISISIYNLLGAEVISKSNTDKINVSELSNGVYVIRISDGIGQTDRKFIKN